MEIIKNKNEKNFFNIVLEFHKANQNREIKLIYEGEINQSLTKFFATIAEKELEGNQEDMSTIMKVYHVTVECLQNIIKHSKSSLRHPHSTVARGICIFDKFEESYTVTTGNHIAKSNSHKVSGMLDTINKLSKSEIKERYLNQLKNGHLSEQGGAGLGFLDLAKKTGNKLDYHIEEIDSETDFFILKAVVTKAKNE